MRTLAAVHLPGMFAHLTGHLEQAPAGGTFVAASFGDRIGRRVQIANVETQRRGRLEGKTALYAHERARFRVHTFVEIAC